MRVTHLKKRDDLKWLREVHVKGRVKGFVVAILHGDESAPSKVELFAVDHYLHKPTVMEPDEDGELRVTVVGDKAPTKRRS